MNSLVTYYVRGTVAWITMNRPEVMNASNTAMKERLRECFMQAGRERNVRSLVLTGTGKAFCAGGDKKEAAALSRDAYRERIRLQQELCLTIRNCVKPVIAAINGYAIGGGLEMALMCDIRVAAKSATMGTPATRIGSISTGGLHGRLAQVVGEGRALHMLLTGIAVNAEDAHRMGLVSAVHDDHALAEEVQALASVIGAHPTASVHALKQLFTKAQDGNLTAMLNVEEDIAAATWGSSD